MTEDKFAQAIELVKYGETEEGGRLLSDILKEQPNNQEAWLWLYLCVETLEEATFCLEKALSINPSLYKAKLVLSRLNASRQDQSEESKSALSQQNIGKSTIGKSTVVKKIAKKMGYEEKKKKTNPSQYEAIHLFEEKGLDSRSRRTFKNRKDDKRVNLIPDTSHTYSVFHPDFDLHKKIERLTENKSGLFGNTFFVDDIRIASDELPICLDPESTIDEYSCYYCDFFDADECIFKIDPYLLDDLRYFLKPERKWVIREQQSKQRIIHALWSELLAHGRPLHYSILVKMIVDRYPKLFVTDAKAYTLMSAHPEIFKKIMAGVYQSRAISK